MKKFLAIFLAAAMVVTMSVVGFAAPVDTEEALRQAVTQDGAEITLTADITVSSPLMVTGKNVTIDGAGQYSISASPDFARTGKDGSVITVQGSAVLKNLTVDGSKAANQKYGVQVYGDGATMELTGVTIQNCKWGAMIVNGGSADANGLTLKNNAWGVEVDNGEGVTSTPSLTLSDVDISEQGDAAIWIPEKTLGLAQVDISGADSIVASVAADSGEGTRYYDLEGALTQTQGSTVVLEKNVILDEPVSINQELTLDGNGNKIIVDFTSKDNAITVTQPVDMENLTVVGNGDMKNGIHNYNTTLKLNGVTVEGCGYGGILTNGANANTKITGTLTLSGNGYGMEVANGAKLDLSGCTDLDTEGQSGNIVWVDPTTPTEIDNIDVGDTGLDLVQNEDGIIGTTPETPADEPSLTVSGLPTTAVVGNTIEFSVTTNGSYTDSYVRGTGTFTLNGTPVTQNEALLEYKEGETWKTLVGNSFGPGTGFPYGNGYTSDFRLTFYTAGTYSCSIQIVKADDASTVVCGTGNMTITVTEEGEAPAPVVTDDEPVIAVTDNEANSTETQNAIRDGEKVEVEVHNPTNAISLKTMNLLGANSGAALTVSIGDMSVTIPGGFGTVTEAGRVYYPMNYRSESKKASEMEELVGDADYEAVEAGGVMTMPTAVTVTLETDLEGTVHVYLYNEDNGKLTYVASPVEKDGKITFTTTHMGHFLLTNEKL